MVRRPVGALGGQVRRAAWLLLRAVAGGVAAAHLAGLILLALAIAVEAADEPPEVLVATLTARLPGAWRLVAGVLGLVGVAVATTRLRRFGVILGLASCGVSPRVLLLVGALCGAVGGGVSALARSDAADVPGSWVRGDGGWVHDGFGWPDAGVDHVRSRPPPERNVATDMANGAAAGACGAVLGLYAGAPGALVTSAVLLVSDVVARGLCERAALPPWGEGMPAGVALAIAGMVLVRAPIFPKRWG